MEYKLCNKNNKSEKAINEIKTENGNTTINTKEIVNTFVNYFTELGKKYAKEIKRPNNFKENYNTINNSMYLYHTNLTGVKNVINSLKPKKSTGLKSSQKISI